MSRMSVQLQEFQVKYDGPALADHTMDVRDLAPALLSIGKLVREASEELHPGLDLNVHVKNVGEGCFITELLLHAQPAVDLFAGDEVAAGLNVATTLGFLGLAE